MPEVLLSGNAVMVWVTRNVKLLLEWVTVPIFVIALQLPQGAALYWLVSSLTTLAQVRSIRPMHVLINYQSSYCHYEMNASCITARPLEAHGGLYNASMLCKSSAPAQAVPGLLVLKLRQFSGSASL